MARPSLTPDDIAQIKALVPQIERLKAAHTFTSEQGEAIERVVDFFERHRAEIQIAVEKEQVSQLRAKLALQYWLIVKWFLGGFLTLVATLQGWQFISGWWRQ